eukprot:Gb_34465 [translate_table: standard]
MTKVISVSVCLMLALIIAIDIQVIYSAEDDFSRLAEEQVAPMNAPQPLINCNRECERRCSVANPKDRCLKYCGICCRACNCVPSGTYGNKDECPCYRDKKNSKGKCKCP